MPPRLNDIPQVENPSPLAQLLFLSRPSSVPAFTSVLQTKGRKTWNLTKNLGHHTKALKNQDRKTAGSFFKCFETLNLSCMPWPPHPVSCWELEHLCYQERMVCQVRLALKAFTQVPQSPASNQCARSSEIGAICWTSFLFTCNRRWMPPLNCGANQPVGSSLCFRKANH